MNDYRDPWVLLGVERTDDDRAIKRAYRKLALQYHPDKNPGDSDAAAMFQEIARAYDAIASEENRAVWMAENEGTRSGPFEPLAEDFPSAFSADTGFVSPGFSEPNMFEAQPRTTTAEIRQQTSVSFREAFIGADKEVIIDVDEACRVCGGSGAAPGSKPRVCAVCRGSGEHHAGRVVNRCAACHGRGFTIDRPCTACQSGLVRESRPYQLSIPAGITDGHTLRLAGPSRGRFGSAELLVTVHVEASPVFKRNLADPADLLIDIPISYHEACFGESIKIPTPEKVIALRVPPGTPSGKAFRVAQQGMPRLAGSGRGDLYARVQIHVPNNPTGGHKRAIQQLSLYDPEDLRHELFSKNR
jgi:molecular chaperone DnaJ